MREYVIAVAVGWFGLGVVVTAVFHAAREADRAAEERARRRRILAGLSLSHRGGVRYSEPEDAA